MRPECDCYVVSGPEPGFFQHYGFWDFRTVQFRDPGRRAVLLANTHFSGDWHTQNWRSGGGSKSSPLPMINSDNNVVIVRAPPINGHSSNSTMLVMRTTRLDHFASTAEIESRRHDILYGSVRVRLRLMAGHEIAVDSKIEDVQDQLEVNNASVSSDIDWSSAVWDLGSVSEPVSLSRSTKVQQPASGACAGIFTYHSKDVESDIEILTSDPPTHVHYANQPDFDPVKDIMIPGASSVKDVPVPWTSWSTHRLDWFPTTSRWYVDNLMVDSNTYRVPDKGSMIAVNLWTDDGEWTGKLKLGESVLMGIEWIEMAYNITSESKHVSFEPSYADLPVDGPNVTTTASQCKVVCPVDGFTT